MLRIGCIGVGHLGLEHIERLQNRVSGAEVVAVCARHQERAIMGADKAGVSHDKAYTDYREMINDPEVDAVVITVPATAHKDAVLACLEAGKPCFVEKPLTDNAAESKEIVDAEIACGKRLVQVGFMKRYDNGVMQMKQMVDSGEFGSPLICKYAQYANNISKDYPYYGSDLQITDAATHEIDLFPWFVNDEVVEVQALKTRSTRNAEGDLQDPMVCLLKTKTGILAIIEEYVNTKFLQFEYNSEIICEDGILELPRHAFPKVKKDFRIILPNTEDWTERYKELYENELQDWVTNVSRGTVSDYAASAWDGYIAAVIGDTLVESYKTGKEKKVPVDGTPDFYKKI